MGEQKQLRKMRMLVSRAMAAMSVIVVLFIAHTTPALAQEEIVGMARAVNGDTIRIESIDDGSVMTIRLHGVDAPDPRQHCETKNGRAVNCARKSRDALNVLLRKERIICVDMSKDDQGQTAATCYAGDRIINGTLVRQGWALAYIPESRDYIGLEMLAKSEGIGLWPLRFQKPWIWRAEQEQAKKGN